ncbi:hypothetical protein F5888DRAFT_1697586 [Russula emetica]|nr:hypothetical protein F5888DRAFT_1697586 [Russula emetica]
MELRRHGLSTLAHPLLVFWDPAVIALEILTSFPWIHTTTKVYRVLVSVLSTAHIIPVNYTTLCVQTQVIQFLVNGQTHH